MATDRSSERFADLVDLATLRHARIAIGGLGAMGAAVADHLVRHHVALNGRLDLVDGDRVESRNRVVAPYRATDEGQPKVDVLAAHLKSIHGQGNIVAHNRFVTTRDIPQLARAARSLDLMCVFFDDFAVALKLADACGGRCPIVMTAIGPHCDFCEIAWSLPQQTVPISITMGRHQRRRINRPQALGTSTAYVASFVAELCICLMLRGRKGAELMALDPRAPLIIVGLRPQWIFADLPRDQLRSTVVVASPSAPQRRRKRA